jgi:hypothetical protein
MPWSLRKSNRRQIIGLMPRNDLELANAQHLEAGMELHCIATDCAAKRFLNSVGELAPAFLCSP